MNAKDIEAEVFRLKGGNIPDDLVVVDTVTIGGTLEVTGNTTLTGALTHDVDLGTTWGDGLIGYGEFSFYLQFSFRRPLGYA